MNLLLCLLGPSFISIIILNRLNKGKLSTRDIILYYGMFLFFVNFISSIFAVTLFDVRVPLDTSLISYPVFALKYLIVAFIFSIILPFIIQIIEENINYSVKVTKNGKKKKKLFSKRH